MVDSYGRRAASPRPSAMKMKAFKAIGMILLYSAVTGAMLFGWQVGVRYLSSPHSEVLKMEMRDINGGQFKQGV